MRRVSAHNAQAPADIVGNNVKARNQGCIYGDPLGRAVVGFQNPFNIQAAPPSREVLVGLSNPRDCSREPRQVNYEPIA